MWQGRARPDDALATHDEFFLFDTVCHVTTCRSDKAQAVFHFDKNDSQPSRIFSVATPLFGKLFETPSVPLSFTPCPPGLFPSVPRNIILFISVCLLLYPQPVLSDIHFSFSFSDISVPSFPSLFLAFSFLCLRHRPQTHVWRWIAESLGWSARS